MRRRKRNGVSSHFTKFSPCCGCHDDTKEVSRRSDSLSCDSCSSSSQHCGLARQSYSTSGFDFDSTPPSKRNINFVVALSLIEVCSAAACEMSTLWNFETTTFDGAVDSYWLKQVGCIHCNNDWYHVNVLMLVTLLQDFSQLHTNKFLFMKTFVIIFIMVHFFLTQYVSFGFRNLYSVHWLPTFWTLCNEQNF